MADKSAEQDQEKPDSRSPSNNGDDLVVVGIGASAGGIQALKEFFSKVSAQSGIAYVVILHMSPEHESKLAEVLQTATSLPVTQVRGRIKVEPNHVYVIPPNQNLAMNDGHLALTTVISAEERRSPVDLFFAPSPKPKNSRAVSVILSGTGTNGSVGLKDGALGEDDVLVEGDQLAQHRRGERRRHDRGGRVVARITRCGDHAARVPSASTSLGRPAEGQRGGLREEVRHEQLVHVARPSSSGWAGFANAMKSAGISRVPWWISW